MAHLRACYGKISQKDNGAKGNFFVQHIARPFFDSSSKYIESWVCVCVYVYLCVFVCDGHCYALNDDVAFNNSSNNNNNSNIKNNYNKS